MEFIRKYGIYVATGLALLGFILLMSTPAVVSGDNTVVSGIKAIFGGDVNVAGWNVGHIDPSGWGLTAWIIGVLGIAGLVFFCVAPFIKALDLDNKLFPCIAIGVAGLVLAAGICAFGVNTYGVRDTGIGGGWVVGGILLVLAGGLATVDPLLAVFNK